LDAIWTEFLASEGISGGADFYREVLRRYGEGEIDFTDDAFRDYEKSLNGLKHHPSAPGFLREEAEMPQRPREIRSLLLVIPDGLFLNAVAAAFRINEDGWNKYEKSAPPPWQHFNRIFDKRDVPYRFDDLGSPDWVGDKEIHAEVVEPALGVLADARLRVALDDFEKARREIRAGTAEARKDAVNDCVKALEGVLYAVLHDRSLPLPEKRQARLLWQRLSENGVVEAESEAFVQAATRISNKRGRHTSPEEVSLAEAEATVAATAVAINLFASYLRP
jgi:hypothetical protein